MMTVKKMMNKNEVKMLIPDAFCALFVICYPCIARNDLRKPSLIFVI